MIDATVQTVAFALEPAGDRAELILRGVSCGPLHLDRLQLVVPRMVPDEASGAAARLQRRRCRVHAALFSVAEAALEAALRQRAPALAAAGFDDVRVRLLAGELEIGARARVRDKSADLAVHVRVVGGAGVVRLVLSGTHLFGALARPAPLVAHDLLQALSGAGAANAEIASIGGLGDVVLRPLESFLWAVLPAAGWRLPAGLGDEPVEVEVARGRVDIRYGAARRGGDEIGERQALADLETVRPGDQKLLAGDLDGAAALYRAAGPRGPAAQRLLAVLLCREATLHEAEELARELAGLGGEPVGPLLALAAVAAERGAGIDAGNLLARVAELAEAAGDDEVAVRAALAAARRLREAAPARSTGLFERVLERRPGHGEAAEALAERYASEERWPELIRLARRRIAAAGDPRGEARERVRLAELFLGRLDNPEHARLELEAALIIDESDVRAWDALSRARAALGDAPGAVAAGDRVILLLGAKGDERGEARVQARLASLLEQAGDERGAHLRLRRAVELCPDDPELLEPLAALAGRRGGDGEARAALARLLDAAVGEPGRRQRAALALARAALAAGDIDGARAALERGGGADDVERLLLASEIEERAGDLSRALLALEGVVAEGERGADVELRRATILEALGRPDEAAAACLRALAAAPDGPRRRAAARRLLQGGDVAPVDAARWIDLLLAAPSDDRGELLVRRALLAEATGDPAAARGFAEAAHSSPGDPRPARAVLARILVGEGTPASGEALEALADEAVDPGERAELLVGAARVFLHTSDREAALDAARRARRAVDEAVAAGEPTTWDAELPGFVASVVCDAAWQARVWDDVIESARLLIPRVSGEPRAELGRRLGTALERRGRDGEAAVAYREAIDTPEAAGEELAASWRGLAELRERRGDFADAAAVLASAAVDTRSSDGPSSRAELHYRAGEHLRKRLRDPARAAGEFEAALRLIPEHMPSLDALESLHGDAGDAERVATILGRKIAATFRHPDRQKALLVRLAELQQGKLGRPEVARQGYLRALEIDPQCRPALRFLADDARQAGDLERARELLGRLAAAGARGPEAAAERLAALVGLGEIAARPDDAVAHLRQALVLAPGDSAVADQLEARLEAAGRCVEAAGLLAERAARAADAGVRAALELRRARLLLAPLGDAAAALAAGRAVLARRPDDVEAWRLVAAAARAAIDPRAEVEARSQLADLEGEPEAQAAALVEQARVVWHGLGDVAGARALLERVAAAALDPRPALGLLLEIVRAQGDGGRAAAINAELGRLAETPEETAGLALAAAEDALAREDAEAAFAAVAGVPLDAAPPALLALRADLLEERGDVRGAAADLAELQSRAESAGDVTAERAVARRLATLSAERLHDDGAAARLLERALVVDPEDLAAAEALAGLLERRGDPAWLAETLGRAAAIARRAGETGRLVELLARQARVARAAGDLGAAASALAEAAALAPQDAGLVRARADVALAAGDAAAAADRLEELVGLGEQAAADFAPALRELVRLCRGPLGDTARADAVLDRVATPGRRVLIDELRPPAPPGAAELLALARAAADPAVRRARARDAAAASPPGVRQVAALRLAAESARAAGDAAAEKADLEALAAAGAGTVADSVRLADLAAAAGRVNAAAFHLAASLASCVNAGGVFDDDARARLARLDEAARASAQHALLADTLVAVAAAESDAARAVKYLVDAAGLRQASLDDPAGAADALARAFALAPGDVDLLEATDGLLRARGDYARLVGIYGLHLTTLRDAARAPIHFELGRVFAELGDPERAALEYALALGADPTFVAALVPLGDHHYGRGEVDPAADYYSRAVVARAVAAEDEGAVLTRLGDLLLRRGDAEGAAGCFSDALERDPGVEETRAWLDHAWRSLGRWEELVESLLARGGGPAPPAARLGWLREAAGLLDGPLGRSERVAAVYASILALDAGDELVAARLAALAAAPAVAAALPTFTLEELAERAASRERLREEGRLRELLAALDEDVAAGAGDRAELLAQAGRVAGELGDLAGAARRLGEAAAAAGDDADLRCALGGERAELLARDCETEEARRQLQTTLSDRAPDAHAYLALTHISLADGDPEAATLHVAAAAAAGADLRRLREAYLRTGAACAAGGLSDQAARHYEEAAAADPYDARPIEALVALAEAEGKSERLAELLGRLLPLAAGGAARALIAFRRALVYRDRLRREPEAYRSLKEAFASDPTHLPTSQALRAMAMARGEWALVAELLYREIDGAEENVERAALHVELAMVFEERLLEVAAGVRNYEAALELDADGPVPPAALARLYALEQRWPDAARAEILALSFTAKPSERAERHLRAGEHLERAGQRAAAIEQLQAAAETSGGGDSAAAAAEKLERLRAPAADAGELRERLLARLEGTSGDEQLAVLHDLLRCAVDAGQDGEIEMRARAVLDVARGDVTAFVQLRRLLQARADFVGLADVYRNHAGAVADPVDRAQLFYELGRLYQIELKDPERAALAFEKGHRDDPGHTGALDALADLVYEQHDYDRAYTLYAALDPESSALGPDTVHFRRGELAEVLGLEDQAEAAYQAAVAQNASHLQALEALARLALYRKEYDVAIGSLRSILELLPLDDVERITATRQQIAELCHRAGDLQAARNLYELVIVEDPARIPALTALVEIYSTTAQPARAAETLVRLSCIVASTEKRAELLYRSAEIYRVNLGDDERASDAYLKAIDLDPRNLPTLRRLVDYYWRSRDLAGVAEMVAELEGRGELLVPETPPDTLVRAALAAALTGDLARGVNIGRGVGADEAAALAEVALDAVAERGQSDGAVADIVRALATAPGPSLDSVRTALETFAGNGSEAAARILGKL